MFRSLTLIAGALVAIVTLPVACSGTEDIPPSASPPPLDTEEGFCAYLASSICSDAVVQACYGSDAASLGDDRAACREAAARPDVCNPAGHSYSRSGAENCLAVAKSALGDAKLTLDEMEALSQACAPVFNAGGTEGAACNVVSDCDVSSGLQCVLKLDGGTCQVPEEVQPGFPCLEPAQQCADSGADEFFCSAEGSCLVKGAAGATCDATKPCYSSAACIDGMCVEKLANGEVCTDDAECVGGFCTRASGATSGTCSSTLALSPTTGQTCEPFLPSGGAGGAGGVGGAGGGAP